LKQAIECRFKEVFSVKIGVADAIALDRLTGVTSTSKIKRVIDNRGLVK